MRDRRRVFGGPVSAPGWKDVLVELAKVATPAVVEAVTSGLRARGFTIPKDPREVIQEARDAADEVLDNRFPKGAPKP